MFTPPALALSLQAFPSVLALSSPFFPRCGKMKFKSTVTVSRRKQRKTMLSADSSSMRRLMGAHLSKELFEKHKVRGAGERERERERARGRAATACARLPPWRRCERSSVAGAVGYARTRARAVPLARRATVCVCLAPAPPRRPQVRSMPIRKGDEVKIMRASTSAKGREGKVLAVSRRLAF